MSDNNRENTNADRTNDVRSAASTEDSRTKSSRRHFAKAGLATPIAMSLVSRPVLAQKVCSGSILASFNVNQSNDIDLASCSGCNPSYWGLPQACWESTGLSRMDLFGFVFGYPFDLSDSGFLDPEIAVLTLTLGDLMSRSGGSEFLQLAQAATASLANARHPFVDTPLEAVDVISMVNNVLAVDGSSRPDGPGEYAMVTADFELNYNAETNEGCPLPNDGNCPDANIRGLFVS